ncbi:MAG: bifunctional sugar-1-phosphate nucleotidylyltransferase/acetyltransferase [Candidatus Thermoplasmatota archaeon]|nr:bifunctional sugar-1-phosphate nucleotidylyltransferase/acetyltransferase [Candidatus Thermoplasmatota archaeon]
MKCVILAAGQGKRMHPLTFTRPKVMLPIANKPILEWNLLSAIDAGLKEFIFVVGYKSEMVRDYFGNGSQWGVDIGYINQGEALGTAHAIGMAEKFVDECVVLCGDTIFGKQDIKNIVKKQNSIGLVEVEDAREYGIVELKGNDIVKIYEKMEKPFSNSINAGIYHFNKRIFDFIKKTKKSPRGEYEITDSINLSLKKEKMEGVFLKEWRDVVYPWDLLDANEEKLGKMDGKIERIIGKNATVKGNVIIGKNSVILPGSYIEGPVVIGSNCKIGPNCYIRPHTSIGDGCHVGNACEVKNSIIMANSNIPHQNYVGDSVIGEHCNLGAGTKIANLRLDKRNIKVILNGKKLDTKRRKLGVIMGDNVQTGINSMTNVGTMVGNNVFIGLGATVEGEIKPKSKIL